LLPSVACLPWLSAFGWRPGLKSAGRQKRRRRPHDRSLNKRPAFSPICTRPHDSNSNALHASLPAVPEAERSPAPGWWWQPAFQVLDDAGPMTALWCDRLEIPLGSTYGAGAAVLLRTLAEQTSLPWPDEFPRRKSNGNRCPRASKREKPFAAAICLSDLLVPWDLPAAPAPLQHSSYWCQW
jgi:hypothetical protein